LRTQQRFHGRFDVIHVQALLWKVLHWKTRRMVLKERKDLDCDEVDREMDSSCQKVKKLNFVLILKAQTS
jgi:hypothetical protein